MKRFDQINVIPFIDIMLVLLAIVLTTATFIAQGRIPVQLPTSQHADPAQPHESMTITIEQNGDLHLDDQILNHSELDQQLTQMDSDPAITLKVDSRCQFADFVSIIDLLKKHQMNNVAISTRHALAADQH